MESNLDISNDRFLRGLPQSLNHAVKHLERQTSLWFSKQKIAQAEDLFIRYYDESRKGELKTVYAALLAQAAAEKIAIQSAITASLTAVVAAVVYLPKGAIRLTLGMLIYWLTQYHGGQHQGLPSSRDARDLIAGIINDEVIKLG